jgi:hypothetical protein
VPDVRQHSVWTGDLAEQAVDDGRKSVESTFEKPTKLVDKDDRWLATILIIFKRALTRPKITSSPPQNA